MVYIKLNQKTVMHPPHTVYCIVKSIKHGGYKCVNVSVEGISHIQMVPAFVCRHHASAFSQHHKYTVVAQELDELLQKTHGHVALVESGHCDIAERETFYEGMLF